MTATFDGLLNQYDRGQLNRRQLLEGLALLTAASVAGGGAKAAPAPAGLAPALSINHVHLNVKDHKRSADFYAAVAGARPKDNGKDMETMTFQGSRNGYGCWLSLGSGPDRFDKVLRPGTYNHVGYGVAVPSSEFPRIAAEVKKRFPEVREPNVFTQSTGQEIYLWDPDGISFQLTPIDHDGRLSGY